VYVSRFGYLKSSLPDGATPRLQAAAYKDLLDHLGIDHVTVVGNSAGGASAMWFAIDYPERTNGLILLSSAVPGPEPHAIPKLVREHDLVYWSAIKFAPDTLIGLLLPKNVRATLTEEEKDFIVENAFVVGLPISERNEGIAFDNEHSNPPSPTSPSSDSRRRPSPSKRSTIHASSAAGARWRAGSRTASSSA
jgi:pimeloyl-ACP methyl ester carboxylesterase